MKEEDRLNKAIQQDGTNTQTKVLEDLKRRYPQYVVTDKQTTIKKMLKVAACSNCYDKVERGICNDKPNCRTKDNIEFAIKNLVNAGYGDIKQALTEFANSLEQEATPCLAPTGDDYIPKLISTDKIKRILKETINGLGK